MTNERIWGTATMQTVAEFVDTMTQDDIPIAIYDMGLETEVGKYQFKDDIPDEYLEFDVWSFDVDFENKTIIINIDSTDE